MSEEEYAWAKVLIAYTWQQSDAADQERPGSDLENITARFGQFRNCADQCANDAEMASLGMVFGKVFLLIWLWKVSKYLGNLPKKRANCFGNFQIAEFAAVAPVQAQTLAYQAFHEIARLFSATRPCAKYPAPSYVYELTY